MITTFLFLFLFQTSGGTITGKLIDYHSNEPIYGAKIVLEKTTYTTKTDKAGKFTLSNIPPGTYKLNIFHSRYPSGGAKPITVKKDSTSIFDLSMMESATPSIQAIQADTTKPKE